MLDRADLQSGRGGAYPRAPGLSAGQTPPDHRVSSDGRGARRDVRRHGAGRGIGVRYSRQGETADQVIARLAAEAGAGAVIVSTDRRFRPRPDDMARPLSAHEFMGRMQQSRVTHLKGGEEEEERPAKSGKGAARRLPKKERRVERRLRGVVR